MQSCSNKPSVLKCFYQAFLSPCSPALHAIKCFKQWEPCPKFEPVYLWKVPNRVFLVCFFFFLNFTLFPSILLPLFQPFETCCSDQIQNNEFRLSLYKLSHMVGFFLGRARKHSKSLKGEAHFVHINPYNEDISDHMRRSTAEVFNLFQPKDRAGTPRLKKIKIKKQKKCCVLRQTNCF